MPPKIRRFDNVESSSSDGDGGAAPAVPAGPRALSTTTTTVSDVFPSSSSSSSLSPSVAEEKVVVAPAADSSQLSHTEQQMQQMPQTVTPPRRSVMLDGPGGRSPAHAGDSSPADEDPGSSAFKDCYSPTGTLTANTSPPTSAFRVRQPHQSEEGSTTPLPFSARPPVIQVKKYVPPPPLTSSSSSSPPSPFPASPLDGEADSVRAGAPTLQGHGQGSGNRKESRADTLSDLSLPTTSTSARSGSADRAVPATSSSSPPPAGTSGSASNLPSAKGLLNSLLGNEESHPQRPAITTPEAGKVGTAPSDQGRGEEPPQTKDAQAEGKQKAKHADSDAWVSSRRTTLDQLRAELTRTTEPKPTTQEGTTTVGAVAASPTAATSTSSQPPSPVEPSREAHSCTKSSVSPSRAGGNITAGAGTNISGISQISPDKNPEVASILIENPDLLYGGSATPAKLPVRTKQLATKHRPPESPPAAAAEAVAGLSPVNRSGTVTPPRQPQRQLPSASLSATPTPPRRSPSSAGKQREAPTTLYHVAGANTTFLAQQLRRRQRLKEEMEAKRMAECTFQPTVSPGSRFIMDAKARTAKARQDELAAAREEAALAAQSAMSGGGIPSRQPEPQSLTPTSLPPDEVSGVYERLYPAELTEAQQRRQRKRQQHAFRDIAREEMSAIRAHFGAPVKEPDQRTHDLGPFLTNVLGAECREKTSVELLQSGILISTSYQSPMSIAAAVKVKHHHHRRHRSRSKSKAKSAASATSATQTDTEESHGSDCDSQEYRIALFDEFLLRQNAHYFNRARTIQRIEEHTTPGFKPTTNAKSAAIMTSMVQRSVLDDTVDAETSTKIQQYRRRGIPVSGMLVKKHDSKYKDPCTFSPQVSQLAERSRSAHGKRRTTEDMYKHLYSDYARQQRANAEAKKRAEEEALEGCTFTPNTNRKHNETVQSLFNAKRTAEYSNYLRSRREAAMSARAEEQRRAQEEKERAEREPEDLRSDVTTTEELAKCTFKPRTSKVPAYISKMANSFGLVRKMDVEF